MNSGASQTEGGIRAGFRGAFGMAALRARLGAAVKSPVVLVAGHGSTDCCVEGGKRGERHDGDDDQRNQHETTIENAVVFVSVPRVKKVS